jgi:hypothetical protein
MGEPDLRIKLWSEFDLEFLPWVHPTMADAEQTSVSVEISCFGYPTAQRRDAQGDSSQQRCRCKGSRYKPLQRFFSGHHHVGEYQASNQ